MQEKISLSVQQISYKIGTDINWCIKRQFANAKASLQRSKVQKKCNTYFLVGYIEEMKVYSRFHHLPSNRQNPFNFTATPSSKAQAMITTPQKIIVRKTNFHILDTWSIQCRYPRHCTILDRKHMYSHLVHSRHVDILGHTTKCNVALDQCTCNKTSGMVSDIEDEYCISSGSSGISVVRR